MKKLTLALALTTLIAAPAFGMQEGRTTSCPILHKFQKGGPELILRSPA